MLQSGEQDSPHSSQSITVVPIRRPSMKWGPADRGFALLVLMVIGCAIPLAGPTIDIRANETDSYTENSRRSIASFPVELMWNNLFSSINATNLESIVRDISETTSNRVWFPLHKAPSVNLSAAWDHVNQTLKSQTGGALQFHLVTEQLNLVAVKNGSRPHSAPIIVAGVVSSMMTPGANAYGASVAAVLETARILVPLNLTNDVYFVLVNTISSTFGSTYGSLGMAALLEHLSAQGRRPAALFWFSPLLYQSAQPMGDRVVLRYVELNQNYGQQRLISDIANITSTASGAGRLLIVNGQSYAWNETGAYDAWRRGIPGFALMQYYGDSLSGTQYDTWDATNYTYTQLYESVGVVSSVSAYLGSLNKGEAPLMTDDFALGIGLTRVLPMPLTGHSYVNATVNWTGISLVQASLRLPSGSVVYSCTASNNSIEMKYLVNTSGRHSFVVTNLGNASINASCSYVHWQDYDRDTLSDQLEYLYGTDSLSSDSDYDLLEDASEILLGTDPNNPDTDGDNALDGIEILYGSDPLVQDTDGDGLLDGQEILIGTDPTKRDTDGEGIEDGLEVQMGLNPLSNDTDNDGLDDLTELRLGTNPLSPDSDEDGLSDDFEVINGLNPLSPDSDGDGLSDAYEIGHCLNPINPDTDYDGLSDAVDWAPREHWIMSVPSVALVVFLLGMSIWLAGRRRRYMRGIAE